ncbi:MAG: ParB/RepB/Spo0J family partition protein [Bacteroidetes bacterium]|nr:ParB/RepB/Spo0J family partition protein [Bacteroidota bacterium]
MLPRIEVIPTLSLDLSLSELRIMNVSRKEQIEQSMRLQGQLQPIIVRAHDGGYQVIDGFKRVYVAIDLMIVDMECYLVDVDEQEAKVLLLSYNRTNQSMEAWEEAMVLKSMLEGGDLEQRHLARLVDRSPSWVSRRLSLISKLDEEVASEIRMGTITSRHARALMRLPRGNQTALSRVISHFHLSSRLSERLVDSWLEAEDEDEQRVILAHPEHFLWNQPDLLDQPYDDRLSAYGNELMQEVMNIWPKLDIVRIRLTDSRFEGLGHSEQEIIYPFLIELNGLSEKIILLTTELQIEKPQ